MITTYKPKRLLHSITACLLMTLSWQCLAGESIDNKRPAAQALDKRFNHLLRSQHVDPRIEGQEPIAIPVVALIKSLQDLSYSGESLYVPEAENINILANDESVEFGIHWEF
ncbi:hypothetical protein EDC56_2375 [Sinobacterium caligoides]|uniref:Uncharacterized protein n=1 Tax=Sinobacterium caligoides TaxID=933926 RepID=A0A3N2DQ30_9GAMM|nr:hypothetical protein [Sinobacterium caligoides]ROS01926.1 hypothetical protein EDC56_2375 [Sinobacterium caligoides]